MLRYLSIGNPVHYWCLDEPRLGLKPLTGRLIPLPGIKPEGPLNCRRQNFYLYGVVEPATAASCFWEFSQLDSTCFQPFLAGFSQAFPERLNVVQRDNGSFDKSTALRGPENGLPMFQPAHSPELNPIERLWQHLKQGLKWQNYAKLDELGHRVSEVLKAITPEVIVSICGWDYITSALLSATS